MKSGTAVNTEGVLGEIPCRGKECAWFFANVLCFDLDPSSSIPGLSYG
jgi:hypothetical protein